MYTTNHFQFKDNAEKIAFMKRYSFATIITIKDNLPTATQLPFFIDNNSDKVILSSHFAVANEQSRYIEATWARHFEMHPTVNPPAGKQANK